MRRNYVLLGLGPVTQADTPIKLSCNFSRDSLTSETEKRHVDLHLSIISTKIVVYVKTGDYSAEWSSL